MPAAFYQDEWPMAMIRQRLDRSDRHLFTELLAHCTRNLTDGVIDVPLAMITDHEDAQAGVEHLIDAGMLKRTDDKLSIAKDWWKKQRSREQVETSRQRNAQHQEAYRQRGKLHAAGDHRHCTKGCPVHGKDLSKALTESLSKSALSSPLLSDDKGGEEKETTVEGSAEGALGRASATPSPEIKPSPRAEVIAGPHVFHDANFTALCSLCGEPEKAKGRHQISGIPKAVISGIAHKAVEAGAAVTVSASGSHLFKVTAQADDWSMSAWAVMDDDADVRRFEYIELGLPFEPDVLTEVQHDAMRAALVGLCNSVAPHVGGNPSEPLHNHEADEGLLYVIFEPWDVRAGHRDAIAGMQAAFNSCLSRGFREAVRGVAMEALQGVAA